MDTDQAIMALRAYRDNRRPVGGFLTSLLENDLAGVVHNADPSSWTNLKDIFRWVYWEMPAEAWQSREAVRAWLEPTNRPAALSLDQWRNQVVSLARCTRCDYPLPSQLDHQDHEWGWPVRGYDRLQRLWLTCTNAGCGHEQLLSMLGVPRPS